MAKRHDGAPDRAEAANSPAPSVGGGRGAKNVPAKESELLATILDDMFKIPGTNFGFGFDSLIGLIPGVGDVATTTLGGAIMADAVRRRVPISVLLRMALNLLIDTVLGYVPFIGDAADFAHRANRKNYNLLRRSIERGEGSDESYPLYLVKALAVSIGTILIMIASVVFTLWALFEILTRVF